MAEKLAESTWTAFRKKLKLDVDDKILVKALTEFEKIGEDKPSARAEALAAVIEQINKQVVSLARIKKQIGDKPFEEAKDKLHGLLGAAEALQKTVNAQVAAEKADEESPALLTTKMVPLLRELKKGEITMNAMVCTAGKNTAVLIMRRPISLSMRKLLADAVDAQGGMKYAVGQCTWEDKALTFLMETPAAGLAKRLRAALLAQTEMRLKVRVRGPDGDDEDGENEDDPAAQATSQARDVPADIESALKQWQASRSAVMAQLERLESEIGSFSDPSSGEALVRVKAIRANITAQPADMQTINELQAYLESDRIVRAVEAPNGFGFSVEVRAPLLQALETLKPALAARQR